MSSLYIVGTPIGNICDISERALNILKSVDLIACEDSRVSKKLLDNYGISQKLISYHKFNEKQRSEEFLKLLQLGNNIALISDAGMPCISDPGRILVNEVIKNLEDVKITCIPGANAITTFLTLIPRETEEFSFIGFMPRIKNQQQKLLEKYKYTDMVFFESANRLTETLENIKEFHGNDVQIAVGRELTKKYEEIKIGSPDEIIGYYKTNILKGEIVAMVYASKSDNIEEDELVQKIKKLKELNYSAKDISIIISSLYEINKNKIYKLALTL